MPTQNRLCERIFATQSRGFQSKSKGVPSKFAVATEMHLPIAIAVPKI
jgi:hypothetical protein